MQVFLGIDGGGTGCRAVLADGAGHVLARAETGPANIASDFSGALDNIMAAAKVACDQAGIAAHRVWAGLGLAGANAAGAAERLAGQLPFAGARIETDAITALRGALGAGDGVVAAIGTGSVYAARRGGVIRQIGGWGLALGDEASGAWIGREILSAALRAVDGFAPMTPLLADLLAEHGGPQGIVALSLRARPADLALLAPKVAESTDPAAQALLARAEAEVLSAIRLLQGGENLPTVFLGGLGQVFAKRLVDRLPIAAAQGTSLDGALQLAMSQRPEDDRGAA